jgi:signal transduction histidine kinase
MMRRLRLSVILVVVNVGLIAAAVVCVARAATVRLQRLADEQELDRVRLAGLGALHAVDRSEDDIVAAARLLAERPALPRLLADRDAAETARLLDRFRESGRLSACAAMSRGVVFARSGPAFDWPRLAAAGGSSGHAVVRSGAGKSLVLVAYAPIAAQPGAGILVARVLDDGFAREIGDRFGMPIRILEAEEALSDFEDPRVALRSRALDSGTAVAGHVAGAGVYLAVFPLSSGAGEPVGILEASREHGGTAAIVRRLQRSLLTLAVAVAAGATIASVVIARWLARPLGDLTEAAARIGGGDFATPIPRAAGLEAATLAWTMEEMRGRLLQLTAELRLRQAEAEAVLTGIVEGVFAVDRERRVRYLNPQAAALLGIAPADALGRFCGDVLNPQGRRGVRPCEENCPIVHARFRGSARATEHLMMPGGALRSVVITSAAPAPDAAPAADRGEEARQFQVMRDETEVEATRRLRDAVLANISHEFRTPLSAQLASIELLRDRLAALGASEAEPLVLALERGTLRLTHLIDNLLESVRIEAGEHSIRRRPVALDEVIEEAIALVAPLVTQRDQQLHVDLPYPLPAVPGDAPRLTQVFVNLLANANKFAPPRSTIRVGGAAGEGEVTLWVEDEGPGLGGGQAAALFERFVRAGGPDDEDEPEQTGMGLGLWIARSIVERHGGRIEPRPAGGGPGTRMCVILPVDLGDEAARR